jgi:hypothetical protein
MTSGAISRKRNIATTTHMPNAHPMVRLLSRLTHTCSTERQRIYALPRTYASIADGGDNCRDKTVTNLLRRGSDILQTTLWDLLDLQVMAIGAILGGR